MKEVTWSPGGLSAFYYKKKNTAREGIFLWNSPFVALDTYRKRKGEKEKDSNSFSLQLLPFDESEKERQYEKT